MAQNDATVTGDFAGFLRPERAAAIFERAARASVVQQLARQVPLGASGVEVPVVTGKPQAGWVAEGGRKPTTEGALALRTMQPKKLAAITVVSAETVRANPGGYIELYKDAVAEAFAIAFDAAALHGTNTPFAAYVDQTTKSVELGTTAKANGGVHGDLVAALKLLVADGKRLSGFAFDDLAEPTFAGATDTAGRPLYIDSPTVETAGTVRAGRVLSRPAFFGEGIRTPIVTGTPNTGGIVGYAGDWSQIAYGAVGGISYDVSTEATVTLNGQLVSLWENNLVAIRAEAEYGLLINDVASFAKLTDNTAN